MMMAMQPSAITGCHITLVFLVTEDAASRIQTSSVIQAPDKYPSQIG